VQWTVHHYRGSQCGLTGSWITVPSSAHVCLIASERNGEIREELGGIDVIKCMETNNTSSVVFDTYSGTSLKETP